MQVIFFDSRLSLESLKRDQPPGKTKSFRTSGGKAGESSTRGFFDVLLMAIADCKVSPLPAFYSQGKLEPETAKLVSKQETSMFPKEFITGARRQTVWRVEVMWQRFFLKMVSLMAILAAAMMGLNSLQSSGSVVSAQNTATQGALQVVDSSGTPKAICPLKHTDVKA